MMALRYSVDTADRIPEQDQNTDVQTSTAATVWRYCTGVLRDVLDATQSARQHAGMKQNRSDLDIDAEQDDVSRETSTFELNESSPQQQKQQHNRPVLISLDQKRLDEAFATLRQWETDIASLSDTEIVPEDFVLVPSQTEHKYPQQTLTKRYSWSINHLLGGRSSPDVHAELLHYKRALKTARKVAIQLRDIVDIATPTSHMPALPSGDITVALSSLMIKTDRLLDNAPEFMALPLVEQYYEACRLINLLGEEFDDYTREYLDALVAHEAQEDQNLLDVHEQTADLQTLDKPLSIQLNADAPDSEGDKDHDSLQEDMRNALTQQNLERATHEAAIQHEEAEIGTNRPQLHPSDSQTEQEHASLGTTLHEVKPERSIQPSRSSARSTDGGDSLDDILKSYPIKNDQYEDRLAALERKRDALEQQCEREGQKIEIYRDATEISLACDSTSASVRNETQEYGFVRSVDTAFNAFEHLTEDMLPPGVTMEHITTDRQMNVTPDNEDISLRVAQWVSSADNMEVAPTTEHLVG